MQITHNLKIGKKQSKVGEYTRREPPHLPPPDLDVAALERDLSASIKGEARFDGGTRGLYAADHSIYRQTPIGVIIPKDNDDVIETVEICRRHRAPSRA